MFYYEVISRCTVQTKVKQTCHMEFLKQVDKVVGR